MSIQSNIQLVARSLQRYDSLTIIQPTLKISQPTVIREREADRVVNEIIRSHDSIRFEEITKLDKNNNRDSSPSQRSLSGSASQGFMIAANDSVASAISAPREPLDVEALSFFEHSLRRDLWGVRADTGKQTEESAEQLNAFAYTIGSYIAFGEE